MVSPEPAASRSGAAHRDNAVSTDGPTAPNARGSSAATQPPSTTLTPARATGSGDTMVGLDAMRRVDPDAVLVDGAGHNAHYEAPDKVWSLLQ